MKKWPIEKLKNQILNFKEAEKYIKNLKNKTETETTETEKPKQTRAPRRAKNPDLD